MGYNLDDECMQLIEMLHEGKMLSHPKIKWLVDKALTTGNCDPLKKYVKRHRTYKALAKSNIALAQYQQLDNPFRPYPSRADFREFLSGPLKLGFVNSFDDMFGLHWDTFCLPSIVPGRVGAGKSMLLKYLLIQILEEDREFNIVIPDLKAEYRDLLTITPHLKVLTSHKIRINPLQVPKWMTPEEHIVFFSKVFSRENWVGIVSENVLSDQMEYLYKKRGIFDGNNKNYPTMRDLYNLITYRLQNQRSFHFRDILLKIQGRLKSYLICHAFDCRIGIPHEVWRTENIVLEMDSGFTDHIYSFTISYITGLRYTYNKKMGLIGSVLRTLFNVDEGRILFAARDVETYDESYITEIITKSREFGVGFIVASPETTSFNQTLKAISFLKVCFPLTDGNEKAAIKEAFGLDDDQADYLFKLPQFGQAIVRYGGYEKPFMIAVPDFRIEKHLSDDEVEERMADFYAELDAKIVPIDASIPPVVTEKVPPVAAALLYFLSKEPFTRVSEMTDAPGFNSPAEVNNAIDWLEKYGFINRESYRVSKKGRKSVFAVLTQKAFEYLEKKGVAGKGNFEHKLYQHLINEWIAKNGTKAKIEGRIKGSNKAIDVLAQDKDRGQIAYELTIHFENLLENIHQDLASGANEVVIVTRDKADMDRAIEIVDRAPTLNFYLQQITFCTIADFFV